MPALSLLCSSVARRMVVVTVVGYDVAVMWVNIFNQYYKCNIYINI